MNLEALALRRAEEQVAVKGSRLPHNPAWQAKPKPVEVKTARPLKCVCGNCHLCQKREWMRQHRAGTVPAMRRGPRMATDRVCSFCAGKIRRDNRSGICGECHRTHRARRIGKVAVKAGHFSHGGGI